MNKEEHAAYRHKYYLQNKDKMAEYSKKWYYANFDRLKIMRKKYNDLPHSKMLARKSREGRRFGGNRQFILKKYGNICQLCLCKFKDDKLTIHHKDFIGRGNPLDKVNNNPNNLMLYCISCHMKIHRKSGDTRGENQSSAKLRNRDVLKIRSLKFKCTGIFLAIKYGISEGTIYDIWNRRTWRHL